MCLSGDQLSPAILALVLPSILLLFIPLIHFTFFSRFLLHFLLPSFFLCSQPFLSSFRFLVFLPFLPFLLYVSLILCPLLSLILSSLALGFPHTKIDPSQVRGFMARRHQSKLVESQREIIEAAVNIRNLSVQRRHRRQVERADHWKEYSLSFQSQRYQADEDSVWTPRSAQRASAGRRRLNDLRTRILASRYALKKAGDYINNARLILFREGTLWAMRVSQRQSSSTETPKEGDDESWSLLSTRRGSISNFLPSLEMSQSSTSSLRPSPSVDSEHEEPHGGSYRTRAAKRDAIKSKVMRMMSRRWQQHAIAPHQTLEHVLASVPFAAIQAFFEVSHSTLYLAPLFGFSLFCFPSHSCSFPLPSLPFILDLPSSSTLVSLPFCLTLTYLRPHRESKSN